MDMMLSKDSSEEDKEHACSFYKSKRFAVVN